jgi:NADH-quinone oxidoreductase subunit L
MEGPTPVSALIHAATMVTAGIYMVARCHVLFDRSPFALAVVACIGAATALLAATIGIVQHDIKRVLAYSTVSQLGYMFLACGVGAYSAAIFHLMTHAFFKALLFLAAGSVIHALSGEQDMRVMGGLRKKIPITFYTMSAGVFAITGMPGLSAFFSKDEILYQTFIHGGALYICLWLVGLITAGLTSFYMFRLWFKTFFGESRAKQLSQHGPAHAPDLHAAHEAAVHARKSATLTLEADPQPTHGAHAHGVHESPLVMTIPLMILAVLAVIGGWVGIPYALGGHNDFEHFLDPVFALPNAGGAVVVASHSLEIILAAVSLLTAALGFYIAYLFYFRRPGTAADIAKKYEPAYSLVEHKYWLDEIYGRLLITPLLAISRLLLNGLVDGGIVKGTASGLAASARGAGALVRRIQSGNIRSYAGWLALGAAAVIAIVLFGYHGIQ